MWKEGMMEKEWGQEGEREIGERGWIVSFGEEWVHKNQGRAFKTDMCNEKRDKEREGKGR